MTLCLKKLQVNTSFLKFFYATLPRITVMHTLTQVANYSVMYKKIY